MQKKEEWVNIDKEYYIRDVSGKEIAVHTKLENADWLLSFYNVWGLSNEGQITSDNNKYYYLKDHLGSIRAIYDQNLNLASAQDYDAWGNELTNRTYNDTNKYKFTSKERDVESSYDYFGARYYDSRIGRWGQMEPKYDKYLSFSSFQYGLLNPMKLVDADGKIVVPDEYKDKYPKLYKYLKNKFEKNISKDEKIIEAFTSVTAISEEDFKKTLKFGQGPNLEISDLGHFKGYPNIKILGQWDATSNTIKIDIDYINKLEASSGDELKVYDYLVQIFILHEDAHFAADQSGPPYSEREVGNLFEETAFGTIVSSYNKAVLILNKHNKESGISKRYKKLEEGGN